LKEKNVLVQNKSRSRPPEKEFHHLKHRKRRTQKKVELVPFSDLKQKSYDQAKSQEIAKKITNNDS